MTLSVEFAQISDCHLYADKSASHYGANVYQNLCQVLTEITSDTRFKFIVFTGDLTQDHSAQSYQNFVDAVIETNTRLPIYYTSGNHDDTAMLSRYLVGEPFHTSKTINCKGWQVQLIDSTSETPSGIVSIEESERLLSNIEPNKKQMLMMHHHAVDVGYFIDRHGLQNKAEFNHLVDQIVHLKAIACGHVHNAMSLILKTEKKSVPLFTCPATSIQFDKHCDGVANANQAAGFRHFTLHGNGQLTSDVVFIENNNNK